MKHIDKLEKDCFSKRETINCVKTYERESFDMQIPLLNTGCPPKGQHCQRLPSKKQVVVFRSMLFSCAQ